LPGGTTAQEWATNAGVHLTWLVYPFQLLTASLPATEHKRVLIQVLSPIPSVCQLIVENGRMVLDAVWGGGSAVSDDEAGSWHWRLPHGNE